MYLFIMYGDALLSSSVTWLCSASVTLYGSISLLSTVFRSGFKIFAPDLLKGTKMVYSIQDGWARIGI